MNRRRGDSEDPHPDYHDQGIPPRYDETRLSANAGKQSTETGRVTPYNRKESK
ncbi:hypothetical protein ACUXJ6_001899 [Kocuria palustris]